VDDLIALADFGRTIECPVCSRPVGVSCVCGDADVITLERATVADLFDDDPPDRPKDDEEARR
jgi:hypothetical protein